MIIRIKNKVYRNPQRAKLGLRHCFHWNGNSRRAGFHDPCGFVTDTYIQTYTKVITDRSPFRAFGVTSLQPIIKERSNKEGKNEKAPKIGNSRKK